MCNQPYQKYPKQDVCISLLYLQKNVGDEVDFLPGNKHDIFLQVNSNTLGVSIEPCPKYPKQQIYNIFATSQGTHVD